MPQLFLVRRGETIWHAQNRYAGRADVPRNDRGREQARALAVWAESLAITDDSESGSRE